MYDFRNILFGKTPAQNDYIFQKFWEGMVFLAPPLATPMDGGRGEFSPWHAKCKNQLPT